MLAPAKGAVAELALVLLLRLTGLAGGGGRSVGGHRSRRMFIDRVGRQDLETLGGEMARLPGARGR
jgi:hypothetical protein